MTRFPPTILSYCLPTGLLTLLFLSGAAHAQMPEQKPDQPPAPISAGPPRMPTTLPPPPAAPAVDLVYQRLSGPVDHPRIVLPRVVYGNELTLDADTAEADLAARRYVLSGHVRVHETDTTLRTGAVTLSGAAQTALVDSALVTQRVFSLRADTLTAQPTRVVGQHVMVTTVADGGRADVSIRAQTLTLDQTSERGTLRNASLYLFGTRLLTVPRVTFRVGSRGGAAQRKLLIPTIGVSSRYGTFLAFGSSTRIGAVPFQYRLLLPTRQSLQAVVFGQQTLYAPSSPRPPEAPPGPPPTLLENIRAFATAPTPLLPAGDPLLFHDFLPQPNPIILFDAPDRGGLTLGEEGSIHVAANGRRRDDLYVSRLPEVTLHGRLPLTPLPPRPATGDPAAFRAALRRVVLYLDAQETIGSYREQLSTAPYTIRARRTQTQVALSAFPFLIAPNTVIQPRFSISSSGYSGSKTAYRYDQLAVDINHYFSDLAAVGVQFKGSTASGDSPFNFDVLDSTRELDVRLQMGNRHLVVAGRVRYDLSQSGVIDYQLALSPALRGLLPVFSYNFRTRSIGLGVEVKGVTF